MVRLKNIVERIKKETRYTQTRVASDIFSISVENLSNKIRRNSIDINEIVSWAKKNDYDLNWLLTGKGEPRPSEGITSGSINIDAELLQTIIISIEEGLHERNLQLEPVKKAELITLLYENFAEADKKVDQNTVRRYLRLVA